jgi:hypothetical protein
MKTEPNKAVEPTTIHVTVCAYAQPVPCMVVGSLLTFGNKIQMMPTIDSIRDALILAAESRAKTATLHSLVLIHARELEKVDPLEFCKAVGVPKSYTIEFRKMISASRKLRELGYTIQKK